MNKIWLMVVTAVLWSASLTSMADPAIDMANDLISNIHESQRLENACQAGNRNACQQLQILEQRMEEQDKKAKYMENVMRGRAQQEEMRTRIYQGQQRHQDRSASFQYQRDANYWSAQEQAARAAGDNWAAANARQQAEYARQKATEYGR